MLLFKYLSLFLSYVGQIGLRKNQHDIKYRQKMENFLPQQITYRYKAKQINV
jgi:hypothetical protein